MVVSRKGHACSFCDQHQPDVGLRKITMSPLCATICQLYITIACTA
ncbi:hypothetical protein D918_00745 [Trichuris suis]|nr:hypothetical protein D918_00745 [Trichuris suis]